MCCFSASVDHVAQTNIFARALPDGRQVLVYSMSLSADKELAMILPLPVQLGAGEDAVEFIDLSGYARFFKDLDRAFPAEVSGGLMQSAWSAPATLKVHKVGSFDASFVPTCADFSRLDARFRLSPKLWSKLPTYNDYGFAVFKLAPSRRLFGGVRNQTIHPMAFSFRPRDPAHVFFPTVHIHDGQVHARATFDHTLYCQPPSMIAETFNWQQSPKPAGGTVNVRRAQGIVDGQQPVYRRTLTGEYANEDIVLTAPKFSGISALRGSGLLFRFRIRATTAYRQADDAVGEARRQTALSSIDALSALLTSRLATVTVQNQQRWQLIAYEGQLQGDQLQEGQYNYGRLYSAVFGVNGPLPLQDAAACVRFAVDTDRVESQHIWLCFKQPPDLTRCAEIEAALRQVLDEL